MTLDTSPERRRIMASVPTRNSTPEVSLRKELHRRGYRYRLHPRELPGQPDIVFPTRRVSVFVHGCFWHRHSGCPKATTPKNNFEFWQTKFSANVERDQRKERELRELGWHVVVVWECEIRSSVSRTADLVAEQLDSH